MTSAGVEADQKEDTMSDPAQNGSLSIIRPLNGRPHLTRECEYCEGKGFHDLGEVIHIPSSEIRAWSRINERVAQADKSGRRILFFLPLLGGAILAREILYFQSYLGPALLFFQDMFHRVDDDLLFLSVSYALACFGPPILTVLLAAWVFVWRPRARRHKIAAQEKREILSRTAPKHEDKDPEMFGVMEEVGTRQLDYVLLPSPS